MLDLSIQEHRGIYGQSDNQLILNGFLVEGSHVFVGKAVESGVYEKPIIISVYFRPEAFDAIKAITIRDLLEHMEEFTLSLPNAHASLDAGDWGFCSLRISAEDIAARRLLVGCEVSFDIELWNRPYSITDLANCFKLRSNEFGNDLRFQEPPSGAMDGFGVKVSFPDDVREGGISIGDLVAEILPRLDKISFLAHSSLENLGIEVLKVHFDFPEEVRPACEQYLVYFGQFLKDLGINAKTEIKSEASQVLFTVTPKDETGALGAIRQALEAYLQIPGSPQSAREMTGGRDMAILQLDANVSHLKGQLALASAVIQAKDATISAQLAEIITLRDKGDLRGYLPVASKHSGLDSESLIEGVLSVKSFEAKGFVVNLPNILRELKRRLK